MVSVAGSGMHTFLLSFTLTFFLSSLADSVLLRFKANGTLFSVCVSGTFWQFLQIYGDIACRGDLRFYGLHGFEVPQTTCELANAI